MKNHYKEWTTTEMRFMRDNIDTMTDEQMGEQLGRSMTAVWSARRRMRILRERQGFKPGNIPKNKKIIIK